MDKIVLITGASSGIGEGCARKFASEGAKLILNARSVDKLEALASDLKEKYGTENEKRKIFPSFPYSKFLLLPFRSCIAASSQCRKRTGWDVAMGGSGKSH